MSVAWGLLAALLWGAADYSVAQASRVSGSFRVVLAFHVLATVALAALAGATGAFAGFDPGSLWKYAWVGALGAGSYVLFYKALEIGPISIVSPIVSAYAAVTVVLAVIVLGERLSGAQVVAVVLTLAGVVLASSDLRQARSVERRQVVGLACAVAGAVAIGGFVFGNAWYAQDVGWLLPIFLSRGFATVFLAAASLRDGGYRPPRDRRWLGLVALVAAVDTGGYVAFNVGAERGETSIVSAASAPYAVIPIAMGVLLLRERPAPVQWLGAACVIAGVVVLGLVS